MIDIKDFKFNIVCDFENRNIAKHSIGPANAPADLRINICNQCLLEVIAEGLEHITDEERAEMLKGYMPEERDYIQEEKEGAYDPAGMSRDELIAKAKELGVEGKLVTFSNKKLGEEIKNKLGGK